MGSHHLSYLVVCFSDRRDCLYHPLLVVCTRCPTRFISNRREIEDGIHYKGQRNPDTLRQMYRVTQKIIRTTAFAGALLLCMSIADACPTCKDGIANGNNLNLVKGYFWSIVFMMGTPFLLLGSIGTYFVILHRKGQKQKLVDLDTDSNSQ